MNETSKSKLMFSTRSLISCHIVESMHSEILRDELCAYQCYAPLPPVRAIVGQGGDLTNLNINCPNIRDIPYNQIPLQKVGDYWGFDTRSVTVQYTETIAVFKMSSEVVKCPTIGAASFSQSPYIARHLPVRGVVGHNIDRCIRTGIHLIQICSTVPSGNASNGSDTEL